MRTASAPVSENGEECIFYPTHYRHLSCPLKRTKVPATANIDSFLAISPFAT
jgi:hypothetical protein